MALVEEMPLHGLELLHNLYDTGWDPEVAYHRDDDGKWEYWQVVGTWADVRVEGWWRRPAHGRRLRWKGLIVTTVRADGHDVGDFRALEPKDDSRDVRIECEVGDMSVIPHVVFPARFTARILAAVKESA